MASERNILGLNRTLLKVSSDENIYQEDAISWEFARNAINSMEKGDRYVLSNEPSNYECCSVLIDGVKAHIVGMIYLYDDKWAIFSTTQKEPNTNGYSEIGIFDKSLCCYIPVVRSKCLNLSLMFPVRGVSRLGPRQNFIVYFGDGYNPDRFIDLGNYNLWPKCTEDRGDIFTVPWLNDIDNIPYITRDGTIGDDCYIAQPVLPLELDCNRLSLTPKIPIPCINVKKGKVDGSLPNGLYAVAIAYSDGISVYGNWFVSSMAHVYGNNNNSIDISIDYNVKLYNPLVFPFKYIKVAVISHVNGQIESYVVGIYSVMSKNITISFIDKGIAEPISIAEINTRKILYEKSDLIQKAGKHLVRIGPYSKFDFNYQPLANLIEIRWFSAEYPEKYYYDLKNNSLSAFVESDVVQYMRDEVYTFYIRWVYDDGNYSSFYHIPGPPFKLKKCDDNTGEQENNAVYLANIAGVSPDGGSLLSEGYVGVYYSTEVYDNYNYKRWNWSEFKKRLNNTQLSNISLPYNQTDESLFDLCGKNIRLVRMPDETTHPTLQLYNPANNKVRYLGVKFSNIYHPLDESGNRIEGIVGFEIWRAIRGANRTIIAKGVISEGRGYNYVKEKDSNNPGSHISIFESYPVEDNQTQYNPFLSVSKNTIVTGISNASNVLSVFMDLNNRDIWDSYVPSRYKNTANARKDFVFFHSPETTFGYPYLNANYIKIYGEVYNDNVKTSYFVNNTNYPKAKILSPSEYALLIQKSLLSAYRVLNGSIKVNYGGHDGGSSPIYTSTSDLATGSVLTILNIVFRVLAQMSSFQVGMSFLPSLPLISAAFNSMGFGVSEIIEFVQNGIDGLYMVSSMLGGTNYKSMSFEKSNDGLLDYVPKGSKKRLILPLYFFALNEVYYENKTIQEVAKPFTDYTVNGVTIAELHNFSVNKDNNKCLLNRIVDSVYLEPYVYTFRKYNINHKYRTQCVLSALDALTPLGNKSKQDRTLDIRIHGNCCDSNVNPVNSDYSNPDEIIRCNIFRPASLRYVSYKVSNTRPYSQIYGNMKIKIGCLTRTTGVQIPDDKKAIVKYSSNLYYGGDTYVTRYTELDKFLYFTDYPYKLPDGFEFNYLAYRNILYPRFWVNTQKQSLYETYATMFNNILSSGVNMATSLFCSNTGDSCSNTISNYISIMSSLGYDLSPCTNSLITLCEILSLINSIIDEMNGFINKIQSIASQVAGALGGITSNICGNLNCNNIINCLIAIVLGIVCLVMGVLFFVIIVQTMITILGVVLILQLLQMITALFGFISAIGSIQAAISCITSITIKDSPLFVNSVINYNLDGCTGVYCNSNKNRRYFISDSFNDLWMYLAHGTVRDFFVESSYNMCFRITKHPVSGKNTYDPYENTDIYDLFSVDNLKNSDFFIYDSSMNLSSFEHLFATIEDIQTIDYNEVDASKAFVHDRRMVIYSLPHVEDKSKIDSWRVYLPLNFRYFNDIVTGIQDVNGNGAIVFFRFKAPQFYPGTEVLSMNTGRELVIGTGGLFRQEENTASNADPEYQYGSMQSVTAVANTPFGIYFISNNTRKIFSYHGSSLIPISDSGLKMWANWYVKSYIKEEIENLDDFDNTLLGVGSIVTCDNKYGLIYFSKRDYRIVRDNRDLINNFNFRYYDRYISPGGTEYKYCIVLFDKNTNNFFTAIKVYDFFDPANGYVEDLSWTLSYDPYIKAFISYHDWKPDMAEGSNDTFVTVKKSSIWVHNKNCNSYCNFYGEGYNFEIDIRDVNKSMVVSNSRSIEYYLECYRYGDDCKTKFHKLDYNFDNLIVYNTEQSSGLLNLVMKKKNDPFDSLKYPIVNFNSIDVLYEKVEQKYRVNMYYDIIKDRGEYSGAENPIFEYHLNGVDRFLINNNHDYNKSVIEHKRFRHYVLNKYFIKRKDPNTNDIPYKMVLYLFIDKNVASQR